MNALDEYDVDDGDFPINEPSESNNRNTFGNGVKSYSSLLKVSKSRSKDESKLKDEATKSIRKPRLKLDFERLLKGSRGLGYLAVFSGKAMKLSGEPGHESKDLSQIIVFLQEWAKLVFPKMPLVEFLAKVEDLCQSKIMKVRFS